MDVQSVWPGTDIFQVSSILGYVITDRVKRAFQSIVPTNVEFAPLKNT